MTTFKHLYESLNPGSSLDDQDYSQLDCVLNATKMPLSRHFERCPYHREACESCDQHCPLLAIEPGQANDVFEYRPCNDQCPGKPLTLTRDIIPALKAVRSHKGLTYALIAPAFLGQFGIDATPGKLRNALKLIGFDGVVEVSLFADILTLKEALEFIHNIKSEKDYQLTSCCCPMWIAMIRKKYNELMPHVPGSVSPMIASGRTIKHLHPDALTVFIGPCLAKKAEAKEPDLAGAIDHVLTFEEVKHIFDALGIDPKTVSETDKDHSSQAGRIYARCGGVSEAVSNTVKRLSPSNPIHIKTKQADGIPACRQMMMDLSQGNIEANFYEGMGCVGGCVGGPKALVRPEEVKSYVNLYGDSATYKTPIDNPYVIELLHRLNFDTVESLLNNSEIFTRHF